MHVTLFFILNKSISSWLTGICIMNHFNLFYLNFLTVEISLESKLCPRPRNAKKLEFKISSFEICRFFNKIVLIRITPINIFGVLSLNLLKMKIEKRLYLFNFSVDFKFPFEFGFRCIIILNKIKSRV